MDISFECIKSHTVFITNEYMNMFIDHKYRYSNPSGVKDRIKLIQCNNLLSNNLYSLLGSCYKKKKKNLLLNNCKVINTHSEGILHVMERGVLKNRVQL